MDMVRRSLTVCAAVSLSWMLSACMPESVNNSAQAPVTLAPHEGVPLPPGAVIEDPGIAPSNQVQDDTGWEGSLRPDTREPKERIPDVVARGRVIVGVDQSQYLLSYRDVTVGNLRGFEIDLAHEIAMDIFGDPNRVDFRFVDSQSRVEALQDDDVDIVINTMSVTPQRFSRVDFSTPYLTTYVRLLVPQDRGIEGVDDLDGKTACVVDGTTLVELVRSIAPNSPILRTRTWGDCLMATQQFHADAVLADDAILAGMSAQDPYAQILPTRFGTQQYAVGVHKGNDGMVQQVNATIERMRHDGTWDKLYQRWLAGSMTKSSLPEPQYRAPAQEEKQ